MTELDEQADSAIREQAARWLCVLDEPASSEAQATFLAWLRASPRHVEEFLMVSSAAEQFEHFRPTTPLDVKTLVAQASASIVSLPDISSRPQPIEHGGIAQQRRWIVAVAATAVLAATGALWIAIDSTTYSTGIGEQRIIEAQDGSVIHLNTGSRVKLRFSSNARDVQLLDGEAMFKVSRDAARPFRVHVDGSVVQAVGTAFNIKRGPQDATIVVTEGMVRVSASAQGAPPMQATATGAGEKPRDLVRAGEQISIGADGQIGTIDRSDLAQTLAWQQRRLVFRGEPLQEVAAEFNRYNKQPKLQVIGAEAQQKRMMGVFDADDPAALVLFIERLPDLKVERSGERIVILER